LPAPVKKVWGGVVNNLSIAKNGAMNRPLSQDASAADPLEALGSNLRRTRQQLGLTLQEVAAAANLTAGFLSQVERGLTSPSISSLAAIALVLNIDMADFFRVPAGPSRTTRAVDRQSYSLDETRILYERLTTAFPGHQLNGVISTLQPGYRGEAFKHEGEELHFILKGSVTAELDGRVIVLQSGDSMHFSSEQMHRMWNHTAEVARILTVVTMDIFGDGTEIKHPNSMMIAAGEPVRD